MPKGVGYSGRKKRKPAKRAKKKMSSQRKPLSRPMDEVISDVKHGPVRKTKRIKRKR